MFVMHYVNVQNGEINMFIHSPGLNRLTIYLYAMYSFRILNLLKILYYQITITSNCKQSSKKQLQ